MGIGMIVAVPSEFANETRDTCSSDQYPAVVLGDIVDTDATEDASQATLV